MVTGQPCSAASTAAVSPVTPAPTIVRFAFTKGVPSAWCPPAWKVPGNHRKVPANLPGVDPEVVSAAQKGDALALDRPVDELAPYVRRLCTRIAPAAADDAAQ